MEINPRKRKVEDWIIFQVKEYIRRLIDKVCLKIEFILTVKKPLLKEKRNVYCI